MDKKILDELHELVDRAAEWPEEAREELEQSMHSVESRYYGVYIASKEDHAAFKQSGDDIRNGRFASDGDVKRVFLDYNRA
jgi:hypothetical protein